MGHYNTVKPGDPFRPSAELSNEVRRFFNGGATISGGKSKTGGFNNIRISAHNSTTQEISACAPVTIFHNDEQDYFYIEPTTNDNGLWGITTGNIAPDSSGAVVVSGIVEAFISGGSGDFAIPGADGKLTRSSSGRAQILYAGTVDTPGIVLLGAGAGGEKEYAGQFAIRHINDRTFEVRYGEYDYAGSTDLPGVGDIPVETLILPNELTFANVVLFACYNEGEYFVVIQLNTSDDDTPQGYFDYVVLGRIYAGGVVEQIYRDNSGNDLYFGQRWFL